MLWLGCAGSAWAANDNSLDRFLEAARRASLDVQSAELSAGEVSAQRAAALAGLLPQLSANAGFTRNQVEIAVSFPGADGSLEEAVISARDQLDASIRADLSLLDVAAVARIRSVDARRTAARHRADGVRLAVDQAVVTAYYRLASARSVAAAARRSAQTARENLGVIEAQTVSGLAAPLDRDRAAADMARADQAVAEAELEAALAERELVVLSGLEPGDGAFELEEGSEELPSLERCLDDADAHPRVRQAQAELVAATRSRRASGLDVVPSVSAFAQERFTNAAGFGPDALWSAGVAAEWRFDASRPAQVVEASRARARAEVERRHVQQSVESDIHEAWHRVRASLARLDAARAEEVARTRAADVAKSRLDAGVGSPLELSVAERDRFDAEVARIRAAANLRIDRRALELLAPRVASGEVAP